MKLSIKLSISHLVMGLFPLMIFGGLFFYLMNETLTDKTFSELSSTNHIKKVQVQEYFDQKKNDLENLATTVGVLRTEAFSKLDAIARIKRSAVNRYFQTIQNQIVTFSEDNMVIEAMRELPNAFANFGQESTYLNDFDDKKKKLKSYYQD
ncbi:hypothetical protein MJH12_01905, partial [bacterium]|nr:hypothetical protein [bacterium]